MKKTLLFAAALVASFSAYAQDNLVIFNSENPDLASLESSYTEHIDSKGKSYQAADLDDKAEIGSCDAFKVLASKSAWSLKSNNAFFINGEEKSKGGIQGDTNPNVAMNPGEEGEITEPTTGSFLYVEANQDGYIYVIHKASSNKNYGVFEEGSAIPYNFIALSNNKSLNSPYYYEVAGKEETADDGSTYYIVDRTNDTYKTGIDWPENICTSFRTDAQVDGAWQKIGAGGTGVISFPVAKGLEYKVTAQGSKITPTAIYFSTTNNVAFSDKAVAKDGTVTTTNLTDKNRTDGKASVWPEVSPTNGIKTITTVNGNVEVNANAPIYNLAGQQVTKAYKGIVIQNGHKFFNVK